MSRKPNKQRAVNVVSPEVMAFERTMTVISIALLVAAVCKALFAILFDLSAITNITGVMNLYRAVESGMGRICLATSLVFFMGGVLGLSARSRDASALRNARLVALACIVCGVITIATGIWDGHNPCDIVFSLVGAGLSGALYWYCRAR